MSAKQLTSLRIDSELASLLPPHTESELATLEYLLATEGCLDPIIVWRGRGIILDGMARYPICERRRIRFTIIEIDQPDMAAAREWMIRHQLGRRNLPPIAASYCRGMLFEAEKRPGSRTDRTHRQSGGKSLAERLGVGERTLTRDGEFTRALDQLATELHDGHDFRFRVLAGRSGLGRSGVVQLAGMSPSRRQERLQEVAERMEDAKRKRRKGAETVRQRRQEAVKELRELEPTPAPNPTGAKPSLKDGNGGGGNNSTASSIAARPDVEAELRRLVEVWLLTCPKARRLFVAREDVQALLVGEGAA